MSVEMESNEQEEQSVARLAETVKLCKVRMGVAA